MISLIFFYCHRSRRRRHKPGQEESVQFHTPPVHVLEMDNGTVKQVWDTDVMR